MMAKASNGSRVNEQAWKVLIWALAVVLSIGTAIMGYLFQKMVSLEVRTTKIEANRFTSHDAIRMQTEMMAKIPPPWFKERVEKLEQEVERLKR